MARSTQRHVNLLMFHFATCFQ